MKLQTTDKSEFQNIRAQYQPQVPDLFNLPELKTVTHQVKVNEEIRQLFPHLCANEMVPAVTFQAGVEQMDSIRAPLRVGCVLSGGQAAGGHNVIVGIYEYIKRRHPNSQLFGFLKGPVGIYTGKYVELKDDDINFFKNRGGFDMIQSGRHKIETEEQFAKSLQYCSILKLDGLVVIGGDDSNTNACLLAEYFLKHGCSTSVIGCPKTIDGDLKNDMVEVSFGFDTACKTYSELIGNIMMDTLSSKKYYHFIRLMGRSASHITLECALLTKPNWAFIGEEVEHKKQSLQSIVHELTDLIIERANRGMNYGVVLVPEGLIEFIDEVRILISEINAIMGHDQQQKTSDELYIDVRGQLSSHNAQLLDFLPRQISLQLLLDRDPHGNVQVAKIETEKLLVSMVEEEIQRRRVKGYNGPAFTSICHYYGYEGRCAFPSTFDCDYCYSLGVNAAILIENKQTGMMSCCKDLDRPPREWQAGGYPLVSMMIVEVRKGKKVPVIKKALVELDGPLFGVYQKYRGTWAMDDTYQSPGPIQFYYPSATPYLIRAPTAEQLGQRESDVDYSNGIPYYPSQGRNMSSLGMERATTPTQLPDHLTVDLVPHFIESTVYSNIHWKSLLEHYPELAAVSKNAFHFVPKSAGDVHPHHGKRALRIGICFNGRQSPGGNVIVQGLLEFAKQTKSTIFGFLGGTKGLFKNNTFEITDANFKYFVNQGGYHSLGRSADKMRSPKELSAVKNTCLTLDLDGLVVVGASHTLTDTIIVSNYLLRENVKTRVVAVPCTVDNNIQHPMLEGIVGFDSSSKTYSQLIGNIMIDAASAVKYWYFIRLMGRDPSHLVLECALQTHPNVVLISEDIAQRGLTLLELTNEIADVIVLRSQKGKEFGTVLVPEGLLAHIGQFKQLISELNKAFTTFPTNRQEHSAQQLLQDAFYVKSHLTPWSAALFQNLPEFTREQLVSEREVNGGVQLSVIETERLLAHLVSEELERRKQVHLYSGSFSSICHFFGYQGRCVFPSLFDCNLAATYGFLAGLYVLQGLTGYCVSARGIAGPINKWHFAGIPILHMTNLKMKSAYGENEPVVPSSEVDTKKAVFQKLQELLPEWWLTDHYENPGPLQFFGPMSGNRNMTLELTFKNYVDQIEEIESLAEQITQMCRYETKEELLGITIDQLKTVLKTVRVFKQEL